MMSLEDYKSLNYKMVVQYDAKERSYFIEFPELPGCMADAGTVSEALEKALKAKGEWLEVAVESGYDIPLPVEKPETTGRQTVRMPKSLHARVIGRAEEEGVSQNQLILTFIAEGLQRIANRELSAKVMDVCQKMVEQVSENRSHRPIVVNAGSSWLNPGVIETEIAGSHYLPTPFRDIWGFYNPICVTTMAQSGTAEMQTISTSVLSIAGRCASLHLVGTGIGEREETTPLAVAADSV